MPTLADRQVYDDVSMDEMCGHCGFRGTLEHKGEVVLREETETNSSLGVIHWRHVVSVSRCQACGEATVSRYVWADEVGEPIAEHTLYPASRDNSTLPSRVRQRLDAAQKLKKTDPASYAVGIRRMLDTVANEQGASGRDLFQKLDDLASNGDIPETLADAAHQLRELGNLGAHDEDIEIALEDVPAIEDLADAILDYLYRAPAKVAAVKQRLAERKSTPAA